MPLNECPRYDTEQSDGKVPVNAGALGNVEYPFIVSLPGPLWPGVGTLDRVLSMGQIELNWEPMLNRVVWNRSVFWHLNCVCMLNGTVWNRTVFDI